MRASWITARLILLHSTYQAQSASPAARLSHGRLALVAGVPFAYIGTA